MNHNWVYIGGDAVFEGDGELNKNQVRLTFKCTNPECVAAAGLIFVPPLSQKWIKEGMRKIDTCAVSQGGCPIKEFP
jgi:hypothetical protein